MKAAPLACICAAIYLAFVPGGPAAEMTPTPIAGLKGNLSAARWTPDSKTLVVAGTRGLFIVDPATASVTREVELKTSLGSLALSPDGTLAAAGQSDGNIGVYAVSDGAVRATIAAQEFKAGEA
ncbi:MAG TPA: hypothetical protein VGO11_10635, partial [Chthoniobacteraceae bacterium]|nr:hypothetical protein [Chthoniobacteraceae bacterium]